MEINTQTNKFIVFEGIDGSGKTTVISLVAKKLLKTAEISVLREPTSGRYGNEIRELLAGSSNPDLEKILDLFINDRSFDVQKNLIPSLENGRIVLMDRYYYSNAAYQGAMGGVPEEILKRNIENNFPSPGMVVFMDISPEEALKRVSSRKNEISIEEECFEKIDFLHKVDSIYRSILPENTRFINAMDPPEVSAEKIYDLICKQFL